MRADGLHEVGRKRVAVHLGGAKNTQSRVEADNPGGERRLALQ